MENTRASTRRPTGRRARRAGHDQWIAFGGDEKYGKEYGMRPCEYDALLGPYHDGELPDDRQRDVEAHVAGGCPECDLALRQLRGMSARFRSAELPAMPPADKARVRRNVLRATTPTAGRSIRWARWLTAAAALVFAVSLWQIVQTHWHSPRADDNRPEQPAQLPYHPPAPPVQGASQSQPVPNRQTDRPAAPQRQLD